jgi:prepilin-type processing-associated H-X9-DG protein
MWKRSYRSLGRTRPTPNPIFEDFVLKRPSQSILCGDLRRGFALVEVLVVMGVCLLGMFLFLMLRAPRGELRRTIACGRNLSQLGTAFQQYAQDHGGCLPPAASSNAQAELSWDLLIKDYLPPRAAVPGSYYTDLRQRRAVTPMFKCPSDTEQRREHEAPRSYAMPLYDPRRGGLRPEPDSPTGVGLRFPDPAFADAPAEASGSPPVGTESPAAPSIRLGLIPAPADTLLLTEHISPLNALWKCSHATVASTSEQLQLKTTSPANFHGGRLNYLMVDGHVEALLPIETVGHVGQIGANPATHYGIWTIRAGD